MDIKLFDAFSIISNKILAFDPKSDILIDIENIKKLYSQEKQTILDQNTALQTQMECLCKEKEYLQKNLDETDEEFSNFEIMAKQQIQDQQSVIASYKTELKNLNSTNMEGLSKKCCDAQLEIEALQSKLKEKNTLLENAKTLQNFESNAQDLLQKALEKSKLQISNLECRLKTIKETKSLAIAEYEKENDSLKLQIQDLLREKEMNGHGEKTTNEAFKAILTDQFSGLDLNCADSQNLDSYDLANHIREKISSIVSGWKEQLNCQNEVIMHLNEKTYELQAVIDSQNEEVVDVDGDIQININNRKLIEMGTELENVSANLQEIIDRVLLW
jgi:hypothetical protein